MEKSIGSVFLAFVLLTVLLSGCTPASTLVPPATETSIPSPTPWSLVVVGDSIAYNNPMACPGCTGFVDRYAAAISEATGHPVKVENLSHLSGFQIDGLLEELKPDTYQSHALANADIIVIGIAHNDTAWNRDDDPCDGPTGDIPDWSRYNVSCAVEAAEIFRSKFENVFAQIVALRAGKPTIFRTINTYNFWFSLPGVDLTPEATNATRDILDAWNAMICKAAQENGFTCADIYHAFNGSNGLTPSPDLIAKGNIHPSDKGNEVIARVLTDLGYAPLVP
jgi:lysophospholipase L1-like esterase